MGLDPGDGDYEGGIACVACENVLFGGKTPKYVLATFHSTVACPVGGGQSIDGAYLLVQRPGASCMWDRTPPDPIVINLKLDFGSTLAVWDPIMLRFFFFADAGPSCQDLFFNENICGPIETKTTGGIGVISWGPDTGLPC